MIKILLFGLVADRVGARELSFPLNEDGCSVADVRRMAAGDDADLIALLDRKDIRVSIDDVVVRGDAWVRPGQEVAIFTVFSGG